MNVVEGARSTGWFAVSELAALIGRSEAEILDLARLHFWPRVHRLTGVEIGAAPETVAQAFLGRARTACAGVRP